MDKIGRGLLALPAPTCTCWHHVAGSVGGLELRRPYDGVHRDQDRELQEEREATAQGVHPRLLVQLHRLFLDLGLVALELLLQLLDLRLDRLHRLHRLDLLHAEGEQDHLDHDGEDDDRQAVVADQVVDLREDPSDRVQEPLEDAQCEHQAPAPSGWRVTSSYGRLADPVDATGAERIAPQDAPRRERRPTDGAVLADRILGVVRARGVEAALAAEPPRKRRAIDADQPDLERANGSARRTEATADHLRTSGSRRSSSFISATRSCVFAPRMASRATMTTSFPSPAVGATSRQASLRIRLARFRWTAPPTRRDATTATSPEPGARNSTTRLECNDRPTSNTRRTWVACTSDVRG